MARSCKGRLRQEANEQATTTQLDLDVRISCDCESIGTMSPVDNKIPRKARMSKAQSSEVRSETFFALFGANIGIPDFTSGQQIQKARDLKKTSMI